MQHNQLLHGSFVDQVFFKLLLLRNTDVWTKSRNCLLADPNRLQVDLGSLDCDQNHIRSWFQMQLESRFFSSPDAFAAQLKLLKRLFCHWNKSSAPRLTRWLIILPSPPYMLTDAYLVTTATHSVAGVWAQKRKIWSDPLQTTERPLCRREHGL